jgi:hypothetical protein
VIPSRENDYLMHIIPLEKISTPGCPKDVAAEWAMQRLPKEKAALLDNSLI